LRDPVVLVELALFGVGRHVVEYMPLARPEVHEVPAAVFRVRGSQIAIDFPELGEGFVDPFEAVVN